MKSPRQRIGKRTWHTSGTRLLLRKTLMLIKNALAWPIMSVAHLTNLELPMHPRCPSPKELPNKRRTMMKTNLTGTLPPPAKRRRYLLRTELLLKSPTKFSVTTQSFVQSTRDPPLRSCWRERPRSRWHSIRMGAAILAHSSAPLLKKIRETRMTLATCPISTRTQLFELINSCLEAEQLWTATV